MIKPKNNREYKCPNGKVYIRARKKDVNGRFCKNECEHYKDFSCPRFNSHK